MAKEEAIEVMAKVILLIAANKVFRQNSD